MENVQNNKNNSNFFSKKKIIIYSISFLILAVFVVLIYKFFINIEFNEITSSLSYSYQNNRLFFLWVFLLILFPIYNSILRILPYLYKLKKRLIRVEWYNWVIFCFITFFIASITPFSMGSEPYIIYWLTKRGLSAKEATALVASFTVINPFMQVLITWPSFFYIVSIYANNSVNSEWVAVFWTVFVGLIFDLLGAIFWFLMSTFKTFHYWIGLIINLAKKIFKSKNIKTKDEIRNEYINQAAFRKVFMQELKDWKFVIILAAGSLVWNIFYYCSLIFSFELIDTEFRFSAWDLFNYANVAVTANNFIPIPGAEGTIQATIAVLVQYSNNNYFVGNTDELRTITNNSVFIWRAFTFYITTILGLITFVIYIVQEWYKFYIRNKKISMNSADKSFDIILMNNSTGYKLLKTINSISKNLYDKKLINVIIVSNVSKNIIDNKVIEIINSNDWKLLEVKEFDIKKILSDLNNKKYLQNEYITFIESGSFLNFESLIHVNETLNTYDIYTGQFKIINNNKTTFKKKTFNYIYKKRIYNKQQMCSSNIELYNMFFNKNLIIKDNKLINFNDKFDLILEILKNAKNIRYQKRMYGYYQNNIYYDINVDYQSLEKSIENDLQELLLLKINKYKIENKKTNKFVISRKFRLLSIPFYYRWLSLLINYKTIVKNFEIKKY